MSSIGHLVILIRDSMVEDPALHRASAQLAEMVLHLRQTAIGLLRTPHHNVLFTFSLASLLTYLVSAESRMREASVHPPVARCC